MYKVLVRGSLSKRRLCYSMINVKLGVGRRVFHDSTPGPMSLARVANGACSQRSMLIYFLHVFFGCCFLLLRRGRRRVQTTCVTTLCRNSNCCFCVSRGNSFRTHVRTVRPANRLVLRLHSKRQQECTFGRMAAIIPEWRGMYGARFNLLVNVVRNDVSGLPYSHIGFKSGCVLARYSRSCCLPN